MSTMLTFSRDRMPPTLQDFFRRLDRESEPGHEAGFLEQDEIYRGNTLELLPLIRPNSVALSVWSPPYFVGKNYESHLTYEDWEYLISEAIRLHWQVVAPGGFLVVNIADILCFKDDSMPKISAENVSRKKSPVTRTDVLDAMSKHPLFNRYQIAALLGCSEQTIDRRLNGNNIRGGKYETQTRTKIVGGLIEEWASKAGFYMYDRRVWVKDAAWENSRWSSISYRAVDEFEHLYMLWKPGVTKVDKSRLTSEEWVEWGSRAVWHIPSVRANDDHEAKFPEELPRRFIQLLTDPGDLVLDCFIGSGTTAIAAKRMGRHFLGIELSKEYVALARKRVSSIVSQSFLFSDAHRATSTRQRPRSTRVH